MQYYNTVDYHIYKALHKDHTTECINGPMMGICNICTDSMDAQCNHKVNRIPRLSNKVHLSNHSHTFLVI